MARARIFNVIASEAKQSHRICLHLTPEIASSSARDRLLAMTKKSFWGDTPDKQT